MKHLSLYCLSILFFCAQGFAQQNHFVYLQSENKEPFFVKVNDKVLTSSASGYLIIPRLEDGSYKLLMGAAQSNREQEFNCSISNKDLGFIIKNTGDQWQLMNIQTLEVITPGNVIAKPVTVYEKETDSFSKMLANAVQDSTILQKEVVTTDQTDTSLTVSEKSNVESSDIAQSINQNKDVAIQRSVIKRKLKKSNKEGIEMVYVDDKGDTKDTIRILIVADKQKKKEAPIKGTDTVVVASKENEVPKDVADANKAVYIVTDEEKKIIKEANDYVKSSMPNSDCKNIATDEDFLRLRKKIVAEDNDEAMIKAAKKSFKIKCFTTEQIKNLSVLFLKDESRYMFFDAAYPFVSDSDNYPALEKQLSDDFYITRFRTMIRK
ncbi:MAG TPA: DUF4476 domain-containing protein [Chitinophagaceae bacterium]|nr:DUF4476 domain-containing protein [Chitinophagaceae bacterium]